MMPNAWNGAMKKIRQAWHEGARRIQVPAGGLLIFNSMTMHQGYPSGRRLAQPISWEPKFLRTDDALARKVTALHMGIATTHWASHGTYQGASLAPPYFTPGEQKYDDDINKCELPMVPMVPFPLSHDGALCYADHPSGKPPKIKSDANFQDMMNAIEQKYCDVL